MDMINPKDIEINGKTFVISEYPSTVGREIMAKYPTANLPKLGDYAVSEEVMMLNVSHAAFRVVVPGAHETRLVRLTNKTLINTYTGNWETLAKLEKALLEYNCTFLQDGAIGIIELILSIAQKYKSKISKFATDLSAASSPADKPPSTN